MTKIMEIMIKIKVETDDTKFKTSIQVLNHDGTQVNEGIVTAESIGRTIEESLTEIIGSLEEAILIQGDIVEDSGQYRKFY
jgi:hypothetical protein